MIFTSSTNARRNLVGRRTRRVIRLGDKVEVQVAKVDSFKKQVDFRLAKEAGAQPKRPVPARSQPQNPRWERNSQPRKQKFPGREPSGGRRQRGKR